MALSDLLRERRPNTVRDWVHAYEEEARLVDAQPGSPQRFPNLPTFNLSTFNPPERSPAP